MSGRKRELALVNRWLNLTSVKEFPRVTTYVEQRVCSEAHRVMVLADG